MIHIKNTQRTYNLDLVRVRDQVAAMLNVLDYGDFDISLWFASEKMVRSYNRTYRNKDKVTDILSFPYHTELVAGDRIVVESPEDKNLGDIIISLSFLESTCHVWKRTFLEHLTAILAHGIAHLQNYDHITDEEFAVMQRVEKKLITAAATVGPLSLKK